MKPKHKIKQLLNALPVDTGEAKRLLLIETKINYHRFNRILNNPEHKISPADCQAIASFFCIDVIELFDNQTSIDTIVNKIVSESQAIQELLADV